VLACLGRGPALAQCFLHLRHYDVFTCDICSRARLSGLITAPLAPSLPLQRVYLFIIISSFITNSRDHNSHEHNHTVVLTCL
jgi:hypothetical protein